MYGVTTGLDTLVSTCETRRTDQHGYEPSSPVRRLPRVATTTPEPALRACMPDQAHVARVESLVVDLVVDRQHDDAHKGVNHLRLSDHRQL